MEENVIGPDGLDMGPSNIRRKFRWVAKLFKDAVQVHKAEFLKRCQRPPLLIHATADKSWCGGGEMTLTFSRTDVEPFDEIWLGLFGGDGQLIEEWELQKARAVPMQLFTSHIPGWEEWEDEEGEKTVKVQFENMMHRPMATFTQDGIVYEKGKWTNWSVL